jgi:hypothetical protein
LHVAGFQDRCLKPLGHPSFEGQAIAVASRKKSLRLVFKTRRTLEAAPGSLVVPRLNRSATHPSWLAFEAMGALFKPAATSR